MTQHSRPLVLIVAVFAVLLLGLACSGRLAPPVRPPMGQTDFTLSSAAFVTEFTRDTNAAHIKYADKVIELTGKVETINNDVTGQPHFMLEGPDPNKLDRGICQMKERFPWARATPGQTVTVKGRCDRTVLVPRLVDCEILSVAGDPLPRLTADEFAKRTSEPELLKKDRTKYHYLIVSGEIDRIDPTNSGLFLKTQTKKSGALIHFSPEDYKRLNVANWQPGQHIEVIGGDSSNPGAHGWLVNCLLMDDPK
jgi:hypothetical protein